VNPACSAATYAARRSKIIRADYRTPADPTSDHGGLSPGGRQTTTGEASEDLPKHALVLSWCRVCLATCAGTEEPMHGDQWDDADGVPGDINEVELGA
jgi:hypothetical protein